MVAAIQSYPAGETRQATLLLLHVVVVADVRVQRKTSKAVSTCS